VAARRRSLAEVLRADPREVLVMLKRTLAGCRRERLEAALVEEKAMHDALFADPETRRRILDAYGALE
jgi:hypothetical protein